MMPPIIGLLLRRYAGSASALYIIVPLSFILVLVSDTSKRPCLHDLHRRRVLSDRNWSSSSDARLHYFMLLHLSAWLSHN